MAINLLALEGNKVSRDLSGYVTLIYGPPKIGKTTFASKMTSPLVVATELGYSAIPGIIAQDVSTWGEIRQVYKELKKPEVKKRFKSIIIDTVDLAVDFCQKYICQQLGIESMGEGGWTNNSWSRYKKEFEEVFRSIAQLGYSVVFLSHDKEKTIKPQNGNEYQQIGSSMQTSALTIIENMCDIIAYAHPKVMSDGSTTRVLTLRSLDNSIRCGSRFRYMESEIPFSYEALTEALNRAIDKEAEETNNQFITNERQKPTEATTYDYDKLIEVFNKTTDEIMKRDSSAAPKVKVIIERYLGKGKKVSETTPDQAEFIYLIINDLKDELL